ncbi:MAG TPA: hypothetical protein VN282_04460 [Pyrinomonadaceae bacterium]|nr:hypothetical protein [Pyrinomonadaceae bacterium]
MRTLLLLPLLLTPVSPFQHGAGEGPPLNVVSAKWTKTRQKVERPDTQGSAPAAAMTAADKNYARNRRANQPSAVLDPNADTIDARSAAIEKAVRESRSQVVEVEGYVYRVKLQNPARKNVDVVFWEYQFEETANPSNLTRRQFLCGVQIKGGKEKEVRAFGGSGPAGVVSAASLANGSADPFAERVLINRVEYDDGSIWQRKGWSYAEVRASIQRAVSTPWGAEMCRAL